MQNLPDSQVVTINIKDSTIASYHNRTSLSYYVFDSNTYIYIHSDNQEVTNQVINYINLNKRNDRKYVLNSSVNT